MSLRSTEATRTGTLLSRDIDDASTTTAIARQTIHTATRCRA
jgi:hypothetical protein